MGDWGCVALYYDYEREDRFEECRHVRGIISKAYKYPWAEGMILHAFNGMRYLMDRVYSPKSDDSIFHMDDDWTLICPDGKPTLYERSGWAELSTAFDVFFDQRSVEAGIDSVRSVIEDWDQNREEYKTEGKLEYDMFACEGTWGFLYMSFTGNPQDGYEMKYAYDYSGGNPTDFRSVLDHYYERLGKGPEYLEDEPVMDAIGFFEEYGTLIETTEEFYEIEAKGADLIRELMTNLENRMAEKMREPVSVCVSDLDDDDSIAELGLSVRTFNCLRRHGIQTIGELKKMTPEDLQKVRNLGRKSKMEILNKLNEEYEEAETE